MRTIFAGTLFLVALIIMGCGVFGAERMKKHGGVGEAVRRLLIFAGAAVMTNGIAMFMPSEISASIFYGIYIILIDCMLTCLLRFSVRYTRSFPETKKHKLMTFPFLTLDTIFLLINPFRNIVFNCAAADAGNGEIFYKIGERLPLYYYHLGFVYICATVIAICFIKKIAATPKIYRSKYVTVLVIFTVVLISHSAYRRLDYIFDFSLIFYASMSFAIYYYSMIYVPNGLIESLLAVAVTNMNDGVVCIDIDGKCVHANDSARKYFKIDKDTSSIDKFFAVWSEQSNPEDRDELTWKQNMESGGMMRYYVAHYKKIFDNRGAYLGCFFIMHDDTDERLALETQKYRATHDVLTGIFNREYFYEMAEKKIKENPGRIYMIVCCDVKNFKMINDLFGVEVGNEVLRRIAFQFSSRATSESVYARISGDRFAICLPKDKYDEEMFLKCASRISNITEIGSFRAHVHIGVYEVTEPDIKVSVMCDRAFMAIKTIKGSYNDNIAYYDSKMRESYLNEQRLLGEFEKALDEGQFRMFLQPQIDAQTEKVLGGEALVRWLNPERGMIPPFEFIGVLERSGLISRLDSYMWETACRQLRKWKDEGIDKHISVNISPKDFYLTDVYEEFTGLVKKYDIDPKSLRLEITETAIMSNLKAQLELIGRLREFGFAVEIDDFGSGYSSLNTLKDMDVDTLKIDMGFLRSTENKERSRTILQMIIALSKQLKMEVITEGVETEKQVDFLRSCGCDVFQGYYFAKPMPVDEFEEKYLERA